jgi:hypothetical protein
MTHPVKHVPTLFPASSFRPVPKKGSFFEQRWVATEVLSFLSFQEDLEEEGALQEFDIARRVCQAWKTCSADALKTQWRSRTDLCEADLIDYSAMFYRCANKEIDFATLRCSRLNSFRVRFPVGDSIIEDAPDNVQEYLDTRSQSMNEGIHLFFQNHAARLTTLTSDVLGSPQNIDAWFNRCENLTRLDIQVAPFLNESEREDVTQAVISFGRHHPNLTDLRWDNVNYYLGKQRLLVPIVTAIPSLTSLSLRNFPLFSEEETRAVAASSITRLSFQGVSFIPLAFFPKYPTKITDLTIGFCSEAQHQPKRSEYVRDLLQGCPELKFLSFCAHDSDTRGLQFGLDDAVLAIIGTACPQLLSLDLRVDIHLADSDSVSVQHGYFPLLTACPHLRSLNLGHRQISDEELAALRAQYPAVNITH